MKLTTTGRLISVASDLPVRDSTLDRTIHALPPSPGGRLIPVASKRLLGMCRWMGSHFHNWTDYNGVTFLVQFLEWGRKFSGFLGQENSGKLGFKNRKIRR